HAVVGRSTGKFRDGFGQCFAHIGVGIFDRPGLFAEAISINRYSVRKLSADIHLMRIGKFSAGADISLPTVVEQAREIPAFPPVLPGRGYRGIGEATTGHSPTHPVVPIVELMGISRPEVGIFEPPFLLSSPDDALAP